MPTVIAHHDVQDKDHWLASPKREEAFGALGGHQHPDVRRPAEPDPGGGAYGRCRLDAVMAAMQTKALAEAMAHDGVLPETLVILVEA
jgi:hypothetical protein